ncbi:MAG: CTP synthase [Clostridia bacterium]|nr:CTP synthase [Clostridia bacterium]
MTKYIFVTGGVVSGLGKGITAASLGRLLKLRGYKVTSQKLDPYMNVDPGTMSPFQHGEVFVTDDGIETDLDLGHYERFIDENLNKYSSITSGKIYWSVLNKERNGDYLGTTVQVIPHITNEIKAVIYNVGKTTNADIVITEIGGTTGDIESQPHIEALRQICREVGKENCCFIHVVLVPYISGSDEFKSKPAQHSVKQLQGMGISPDIILTRADQPLPQYVKDKLAIFCSVEPECCIENLTVPVLYEAPMMLEKQNFSSVVCKLLRLDPREINLTEWQEMLDRVHARSKQVKIALCGKYVQLHDAYLSVAEALAHGGYENDAKVEISWVDTRTLTEEAAEEQLGGMDGIIVPGGFGERGVEGMMVAVKYARENNIPYFGICLGMQIAAVEFARNVLKLEGAGSAEFQADCKNRVIDLMHDQYGVKMGGTMRLGAYPCKTLGPIMKSAYGKDEIAERHRHRYEFNNEYRKVFEENGMVIAGTSPDGMLCEAIEYPKNDFFIGVQFHPEFKSRPNNAHPLFREFIKSAVKHMEKGSK